jgi:uncharacterized protein involved in exopolysaccharide biosynthesis
MRTEPRRQAPAPEPQPAPEVPLLSEPASPSEPGASDATLIIFLVGVMLMLAVCVGFILAAS